jgi:hypothetical protein
MEPRQERIDLASAVLLSATALISAWSAYQAARWGGVESLTLARGSALRAESVRTNNVALQQSQIDVTAFVAWLQDRAQGNQTAADVIAARFRAEFVPAFQAWLASGGAAGEVVPAGTPFQRPEYQLASRREAAALEARASEAASEAQRFNQIGDNFVFAVVILTTSVFVSGIQTKIRAAKVRLGMLVVALLLMVVATTFMLSLPQNFGL